LSAVVPGSPSSISELIKTFSQVGFSTWVLPPAPVSDQEPSKVLAAYSLSLLKAWDTESSKTKGAAAAMPETFKIIELVGTSPVSFAEAVKSAVAEASASVRHLDWFEVVNERGKIANGKVEEFQVTLKIGFKIER